MGKGDIRSRRGKIWRGTTGVTRPRKKSTALRPAVPTRKLKTLKDLPKAVSEPIVKKPVVEAVKHQVAETVPVIETVQPVAQGITAEVPQIVSESVVETTHKEVAAKKVPAKKAATKKAPATKKVTVSKKPVAKKVPAKKKKK